MPLTLSTSAFIQTNGSIVILHKSCYDIIKLEYFNAILDSLGILVNIRYKYIIVMAIAYHNKLFLILLVVLIILIITLKN